MRGAVWKSCVYSVTDREENHADSITHIGLAAAAVTAAF